MDKRTQEEARNSNMVKDPTDWTQAMSRYPGKHMQPYTCLPNSLTPYIISVNKQHE